MMIICTPLPGVLTCKWSLEFYLLSDYIFLFSKINNVLCAANPLNKQLKCLKLVPTKAL